VKRDAQVVHQYLIPEFGNVPLESFTQGHVKDLIVKLKAENRPKASIARILAPLKRAFNDAVRDRVINQNPVARIEIGRDEHQFHRVRCGQNGGAAHLRALLPVPRPSRRALHDWASAE
jgi:site-specific recombinase XerD